LSHDDVFEFFRNSVSADLFHALLGPTLGTGCSRTVYEMRHNPDLVVKFETGTNLFQNVEEWRTWKELKDTTDARWLAPCLFISPCASVLVQARTHPAPNAKFLVHRPEALQLGPHRQQAGVS